MKAKTTEWWLVQAAKVSGKCLKCGHHTDGVYVPPGRGMVLECAIVESCRMCGWECTLVRGMAGQPVASNPRPTSLLKQVGVASVKGQQPVKLPGQPRRGLASSGPRIDWRDAE